MHIGNIVAEPLSELNSGALRGESGARNVRGQREELLTRAAFRDYAEAASGNVR